MNRAHTAGAGVRAGPQVYLAIDNCFASKRWCEPGEWMRIVRDLGLSYVEASADNEIDPLYSRPAHIDDWLAGVRTESEKTGVSVVNCYSGHGTYSTLGLGHYDERVRRHIETDWVVPMLRLAGSLGAGLGFFAHAFPEKVLCDRDLYRSACDTLIDSFRRLSKDAERCGVRTFAVEQMYSPHQVPWTLAGADDFLRKANDKPEGLPVYITIDTGHQSGQARFLPPSRERTAAFVEHILNGQPDDAYVGPLEFYNTFRSMARKGAGPDEVFDALRRHVEDFPYLFAMPDDGDTIRWLEAFAAWSPIIHLQQTDGTQSAHLNFTRRNNKRGIIHAAEVLEAVKAGFERAEPHGFPTKVRKIYLTLEPFLPTASHSRVMLEEIAESVAYWRRYVPRDGMGIEEICSRIRAERRSNHG